MRDAFIFSYFLVILTFGRATAERERERKKIFNLGRSNNSLLAGRYVYGTGAFVVLKGVTFLENRNLIWAFEGFCLLVV